MSFFSAALGCSASAFAIKAHKAAGYTIRIGNGVCRQTHIEASIKARFLALGATNLTLLQKCANTASTKTKAFLAEGQQL